MFLFCFCFVFLISFLFSGDILALLYRVHTDWEVENYDAVKISNTFQKIIFWLVRKIHLISCQKLY